MPEQFNKDEVRGCLAVIRELTEALSGRDRAIDRIAEEIEGLADERLTDDGDYAGVARRISNWNGTGGLGYDLRKKSIPQLQFAESVLHRIIATNTIHVFEYQIPGTVRGSIGDISQFRVDLDPTE